MRTPINGLFCIPLGRMHPTLETSGLKSLVSLGVAVLLYLLTHCKRHVVMAAIIMLYDIKIKMISKLRYQDVLIMSSLGEEMNKCTTHLY